MPKAAALKAAYRACILAPFSCAPCSLKTIPTSIYPTLPAEERNDARKVSYLMITVVVLLSAAIVLLAVEGDLVFNRQSNKLSGLKAENEAIKQQQISLAQAKADLQKYENLDKIAKTIVPQDKDQAKTIREINAIASQSGVSIQQINFDASTLGGPVISSTSGSSSTTGSASAGPSITQVKPVAGITGVYALDIIVSSGTSSPVPYDRFLKFLENLENNRRTAHVISIDVTPYQNNPGAVTFSLTVEAYLKP